MNRNEMPGGEQQLSTKRNLSDTLHTKARKEKPSIYPDRFLVPDDKVRWDVDYPEYQPPYFVADVVLDNDSTKKPNGWADPESQRDAQRTKNPQGRTGIEGRGLLGKWEANYAADPIVSRLNPETGLLEILVIQRKDTKEWAIPGGMVDKGEKVSATLKREFQEEAGINLDMDDAVEVYQGYVDDPRNTDDAWMETTAMHKHLDPDLARKVNPEAGDDAQAVRWVTLNSKELANLYASHGTMIKQAVKLFYDDSKEKLSSEVISQLDDIFKEAE